MNVKEVAKLARLQLSPEQSAKLEKDFTNILEYFGAIEKINTENIEPLLSPGITKQNFREDVSVKWDESNQVLDQAPEVAYKQFKVPPVV